MWGRGPPVWGLFVVGGVATVAVGGLPAGAAASALASAAPVLLFLAALFVLAGALEQSGALRHLARWLVGRARRPEELPAVIFVGFGLASAFLVNDALVVIGVPVLLAVARDRGLPSRPLLLSLAFAVTVGSVLTPFGNPQNLLVSIDSGIRAPVTTFLRWLLVPTLINLGLGALYVRWRYRRDLRVPDPSAGPRPRAVPRLLPRSGWGARLRRNPVLAVFPATVLALIGTDVASAVAGVPEVPIWITAAVGAAVLLAASPHRGAVIRRANGRILLLFAGLFVVVAGAVHGGLVSAATSAVRLPGPSQPVPSLLAITGTSVVGAQLVSNVPWVGLEIPALVAAGFGPGTPVAWVALAGASTLAGNVTLLGAASNLIVADLGERAGVPIGLRAFVRDGLPLAALCLAVLLACLVVGL